MESVLLLFAHLTDNVFSNLEHAIALTSKENREELGNQKGKETKGLKPLSFPSILLSTPCNQSTETQVMFCVEPRVSGFREVSFFYFNPIKTYNCGRNGELYDGESNSVLFGVTWQIHVDVRGPLLEKNATHLQSTTF